jgi:hypothetical protein
MMAPIFIRVRKYGSAPRDEHGVRTYRFREKKKKGE